VLILAAEIGEGHLTVARRLAGDLRARPEVESVVVRSDLEVMGERLGRFLTRNFEVHLDRIGWTYDLAYQVFFVMGPPRRAAHLALAALGGRPLRRAIAQAGADLVVADYPVLSAALGQLRALGRLPVPVCSAVSDPAGLHYWAHPGIDLHLLCWPESLSEVDRIAGPGRAVAVAPLIDPRFLAPPDPAAARAALDLPAAAPVVLVSGGGWGVGDLAGAVAVTVGQYPEARVIALAGRNQRTAARLHAAYGSRPHVRVLGFTDAMPALLAAADVLIHTTGGVTALEARASGCPLINYGTGPGHVREHARALAAAGLAGWAPDRRALPAVLAQVLARGRAGARQLPHLPDAAGLVAALASRRNHRAARVSASAAGRGA
jgi:UDP-N-acetylglucosamine:LPS N-acetylglucosamine transferase